VWEPALVRPSSPQEEASWSQMELT
jgi:hypothetical protein